MFIAVSVLEKVIAVSVWKSLNMEKVIRVSVWKRLFIAVSVSKR